MILNCSNPLLIVVVIKVYRNMGTGLSMLNMNNVQVADPYIDGGRLAKQSAICSSCNIAFELFSIAVFMSLGSRNVESKSPGVC